MILEPLSPFGVKGIWPKATFSLDDLVVDRIVSELFTVVNEYDFILFEDLQFDQDPDHVNEHGENYEIVMWNDARVDDNISTLLPHTDTFSDTHIHVMYKPVISPNEPQTRIIPYEVGFHAVKIMLEKLMTRMDCDASPYVQSVAEDFGKYEKIQPLAGLLKDLKKSKPSHNDPSEDDEKILKEAAGLAYAVLTSELPLRVKQSAASDFAAIVARCPDYRIECRRDVNNELQNWQEYFYSHVWKARQMIVLTGSPRIMHQKYLIDLDPKETVLLRAIVKNLS